MCRFVDAGSGVARRPLVWLSLLAWAGCTLLAHWFLPTLPAHRFDVEAAARAGEMQDADFNDRHAFPSTWWNVLGISPDGDTVVYRYRSNGILRYCNTKNGECRNTSSETMVKPSELFAPEQAWRVKILADSGDGKRLVQFVHRETGKSSPRIPANFVGSANGRLVIYEDGESNFLHDLETGHTRLLAPTAEKDGHSPFAVHCFSDDGRLAVGANGGNVLIIDVETGTIAKVLPSRNDEHRIFPSNVSLTPDGHGVAWESRRGVVISDLADTKRLVLPDVRLIGWLPSGLVLVAEQNDLTKPSTYVETWNWQEKRRVARWDAKEGSKFTVAKMTSWVTPPTSIAELSADGRHVLFGGYVHRTNPDWLATVRKWLRLPDPPPLVIEASLLDSETLTLVAPFRIPAEQQRLGVFRFTTDGRYLVFTDGHVVEHYALPLRSWLTSALWAGIAPLTLIAIVSTWQFWRRRKRDTISPTPPTANVPEVSDAKT